MNTYQLWLKLTYWFHEAPAIYIPTLMDIIAVVVLLVFIKRFREMRAPLLAMYVLILLHAFVLPYSFTLGFVGAAFLFFFLIVWGAGFLICFLLCQATASRIEDNKNNRRHLRIGAAFLAGYLLLNICLMFC